MRTAILIIYPLLSWCLAHCIIVSIVSQTRDKILQNYKAEIMKSVENVLLQVNLLVGLSYLSHKCCERKSQISELVLTTGIKLPNETKIGIERKRHERMRERERTGREGGERRPRSVEVRP